MKKIDALIDQYNADTEVLPENRVEEFFIPSLVVQQPINLIFVYARPSAFDRSNDAIYSRYWGSGKHRLSLYTDSKGEAVTVRPQLMKVFINGCLEYLERLTIHAKESEITDGIEVTSRHGAVKSFGMERFAQGLMWVMGEVLSMLREWMPWAPDEREGRVILAQVLVGGNFGIHTDVHTAKASRRGKVLRTLLHTLHLFRHYPAEAFSAPVWAVYNRVWILVYRIKLKHQ